MSDYGQVSIRLRVLAIALLIAVLTLSPHTRSGAGVHSAADLSASAASGGAPWTWPIDGARFVANPYRAPAHEYGAGHRGIDIVSIQNGVVRAPADGVVAFRGTVVDRPLLTIEHADGYVSTFEPMISELSAGDVVSAGDEIGAVASGGHASAGTMHLGVRLDRDYINPMLLFGEVPRAVLLPCCDPL